MTEREPGGRPRAIGPRRRARDSVLIRRCVLALLLLGVVVSVEGRESPTATAARTWHVATSGSDGAPGTSSQPLRTVTAAVDRAASGDTIELRGGVYRESVQIFREALHLRSRPGERAVLDGSIPLGGWRRSGNAWFVEWTYEPQLDFGPMVLPNRPQAGFPDQVFVDGAPLGQALAKSQLGPTSFFHDRGANRLWVGLDPAGRTVTASNRSWGLYLNEADGSRVTNITVRAYATERRHVAAVRAYADDLILDGVVAEDNAAIGISAIGSDISIRNGRASGNGYLGVHADRATRLDISAMSVMDNNRAGFDPFHSAGGVKVTSSSDVVIRDSDVSANDGPGIWVDVSSRAATVVGNLATNNLRSGVQVELTNGSVVAGNASIANGENGVWVLESTDALVWNNTLIDNVVQLEIEEGPRRDVRNVSAGNNVLGTRSGAGRALLDANDWTENRSARQMGVTTNHNVFRVSPGSSVPVSRWGRWPAPLAVSATIGAHRSATGQGSASTRSVGAGDVLAGRGCQVVALTASTGALPGPAARALGVGSVAVAGTPTAPVRRGMDWPADARQPPSALGGDLTESGLRRGERAGRTLPIPCP